MSHVPKLKRCPNASGALLVEPNVVPLQLRYGFGAKLRTPEEAVNIFNDGKKFLDMHNILSMMSNRLGWVASRTYMVHGVISQTLLDVS